MERRRFPPPRMSPARMAVRMSLAGQVLTLQLAIVVAVLGVVAWVSVVQANADWRRTEGGRLLSTAESVAAQRVVRVGLADPHRVGALHAPAESARGVSGASFVEIATWDRRLLTSADPRRIGGRVELGGSDVLEGRSWVGTVAVGGGTALVAHVPVFGEDGVRLGLVAVGSEERSLARRVEAAAPDLLLYLGIASGLGVAGSYLLARRVKRQTRGLEPGEITALAEHREAMLHGIKEGVLGLDGHGRVTLVNDSARELLRLPPGAAGRTLAGLGVDPVLREALTGGAGAVRDQVVVTADRVLTLNRMPLDTPGQPPGSVTTMRDLTELTTLQHQLETARGATDTLRAQAHEFSNHLHVIAGLVELAEYPEVSRYVRGVSGTHAQRTAHVQAAVADPSLAALLIAKASLAAEQGTALRVTPDSALGTLPESLATDLVTVLGNLVDNALDAVRGTGPDARVDVRLAETAAAPGARNGEVRVEVTDSGPGVAPALAEEIFRQGFSTKASGRGLGLAITRLVCRRRGGSVGVRGAAFLARLPRTPDERPAAAPAQPREAVR
ncbi:sensor histidine kinase [Streptomyces sp. NPDC049881]|uniref:sensor histidine kinase n=1 Tax=Streptomyces sp. NPDC049881 TaxID=3155778 RepID=UPI00343AAB22